MVRDDERARMVARLEAHGYVRTRQVRDALLKVERHMFLPGEMAGDAYRDSPLPIGQGQTISAPHMVAMMAEMLAPQPGACVLEIGGGSGYAAAVMAESVGPDGVVVTVERMRELAEVCRANLERTGYGRVAVVYGDGALGHPERAPYDCISVACAARSVPDALVAQLADGGRMAIPIGAGSYQELLLITKRGGSILREDRGGVAFVPLVSDKV
jgi:protein-L-isoaspartate(D-aspartate) O-methyltransferase